MDSVTLPRSFSEVFWSLLANCLSDSNLLSLSFILSFIVLFVYECAPTIWYPQYLKLLLTCDINLHLLFFAISVGIISWLVLVLNAPVVGKDDTSKKDLTVIKNNHRKHNGKSSKKTVKKVTEIDSKNAARSERNDVSRLPKAHLAKQIDTKNVTPEHEIKYSARRVEMKEKPLLSVADVNTQYPIDCKDDVTLRHTEEPITTIKTNDAIDNSYLRKKYTHTSLRDVADLKKCSAFDFQGLFRAASAPALLGDFADHDFSRVFMGVSKSVSFVNAHGFMGTTAEQNSVERTMNANRETFALVLMGNITDAYNNDKISVAIDECGLMNSTAALLTTKSSDISTSEFKSVSAYTDDRLLKYWGNTLAMISEVFAVKRFRHPMTKILYRDPQYSTPYLDITPWTEQLTLAAERYTQSGYLSRRMPLPPYDTMYDHVGRFLLARSSCTDENTADKECENGLQLYDGVLRKIVPQGSRCFFCGVVLSAGLFTVWHLLKS